jgi:hypothetical protein
MMAFAKTQIFSQEEHKYPLMAPGCDLETMQLNNPN